MREQKEIRKRIDETVENYLDRAFAIITRSKKWDEYRIEIDAVFEIAKMIQIEEFETLKYQEGR